MNVGKRDLKPLEVSRLKAPGRHRVSEGLYLQVRNAESRSWLLRYTVDGKAREMGLGAFPQVSLATASAEARRYREALALGRDPLAERAAEKQARDQEAQARELSRLRSKTFKECAEAYVDSQKAGWRNAKHRQQWSNTLRDYAFPKLGSLPVSAVDTGLVMQVLQPLWETRTETATRLRGRIEAILDWSGVQGFRSGENPAVWRGHLEHLLPNPGKVARVVHHPAMPYSVVAAFLEGLKDVPGASALALRFIVLTACRSGEARGATWGEVDLKAKVWTVPATRMKAAREHKVPLSPQALAVLEEAAEHFPAPKDAKARAATFIFPSRAATALSDMALSMLMRRQKQGEYTVHGFRSTFRDWAAEQTAYPRAVVETALAHGNPDRVEAAYLRSDFIEKRTRLMAEWGTYATTPAATDDDRNKVVLIRKRGR